MSRSTPNRWATCMLGLLVVLTMTTATAQGQKRIGLQTWFYSSPINGEILDWAIAEFEQQHPDVVIEPLSITNEAYWDRLALEIVSGTEACIVALDTGAGMSGYYGLREGGAFIGLDDYIDGYVLPDGTSLAEDILLIDNHRIDGKTIALPYIWFAAPHTAYRESHLDAAGINPEQLTTWEGFFEAAQALTLDKDGDGRIDQYGFGHPSYAEVISRWWHMHWLWTAGGGIFPNEEPPFTADRLIFNSPENLRAVEYLVEITNAAAPPGEKRLHELLEMFYASNLSMVQVALWTVGNLEADMRPDGAFENDLGFAPFPALVMDGVRHEPVYVAWGNPLAISTNCAYPDEAFEFIAFLHSEESQRRHSVTRTPVNKRVLGEWYEENYPVQAEFVNMALEYEMRIVPDMPQWNEIDHIVQQALNSALVGARTPAEALEWGQRQMERVLAR